MIKHDLTVCSDGSVNADEKTLQPYAALNNAPVTRAPEK